MTAFLQLLSLTFAINLSGYARSADCNLIGYSIESRLDTVCEQLIAQNAIACSLSSEIWSMSGCGCGCKPACLPLGYLYFGNGDNTDCSASNCPPGFEAWSDSECGCGCSPIIPGAKVDSINLLVRNVKTFDDGPFFGFIHFAGNPYAIYQFILTIVILIVVVLNAAVVAYACWQRCNRMNTQIFGEKKSIYYSKTATECSDDDTSEETET